jgi:flagellar export protein FliJ
MAFKFQNILNHRKTILDKKYAELSEVQKRVALIYLAIFDVQKSLESFKKSYSAQVVGISDIYGYNTLEAGYKSLQYKLNELLAEQESAEHELEIKKKSVIEAKIEYEKINKLREKHLAIDKINELKREEAAVSDFASNRFIRE